MRPAAVPFDGEWIEVGVVARPHGIKGAVHVDWLPQFAGPAPGRKLYGRDGEAGQAIALTVAECDDAGANRWRLRFGEIADRNGVEGLKGWLLYAARGDVETVSDEEGEALGFALVGLTAIRTQDNSVLGEIVEFRADEGGGGLWVIRRAGGGELLVPLADEFIAGVDEKKRVVALLLPDGLEELGG